MSRQIRSLANAIRAFRDLDAEIQAQTVLTFLLVADATEPVSMRDLQGRLDISTSSVSRNVAALSKHHRLGKDGLDLVEAYEDPADRRNKVVRLTAKGRAFSSKLTDLLR